VDFSEADVERSQARSCDWRHGGDDIAIGLAGRS
jgi:hypothetical protein